MKTFGLIAALALLVGTVAYAAGVVYYTQYSTTTLAGAPDAGNTWTDLGGASYFRVTAIVDAGSAFGAGTLRCYFRDAISPTGQQRCQGADFTLAPLDAGTVTSQAFQTGVTGGQLYYAPDSVTMLGSVDGGGRFDIRIEVQK